MGIRNSSSNIRLLRGDGTITIDSQLIELAKPARDKLERGLELLRDELEGFDGFRENVLRDLDSAGLDEDTKKIVLEDLEDQEQELSKVQELLLQLESSGLIVEDARRQGGNVRLLNKPKTTAIDRETATGEADAPGDEPVPSNDEMVELKQTLDSLRDTVAKSPNFDAEQQKNILSKIDAVAEGLKPRTMKSPRSSAKVATIHAYQLRRSSLRDISAKRSLELLRSMDRPEVLSRLGAFMAQNNLQFTPAPYARSGEEFCQRKWTWENDRGRQESFYFRLERTPIDGTKNLSYKLSLDDKAEEDYGYGDSYAPARLSFSDVNNPENLRIGFYGSLGLKKRGMLNNFVQALLETGGNFIVDAPNEDPIGRVK